MWKADQRPLSSSRLIRDKPTWVEPLGLSPKHITGRTVLFCIAPFINVWFVYFHHHPVSCMMGDFRTIPLSSIFRVRISVVYFLNRVTENLSWNSFGAKRTEYSVEILGTRVQPVLTHYEFALPNYLRSSPNCPRSPQNIPKLCIWVYSVAFRVFFELDSWPQNFSSLPHPQNRSQIRHSSTPGPE